MGFEKKPFFDLASLGSLVVHFLTHFFISLANLSGNLGVSQTKKSMLNFQSPRPFGNRMAQSSMTLNNFGGRNTTLSQSTTNLTTRTSLGGKPPKEPEIKYSLTSTILIDLPKKPRKEKSDEWMIELVEVKPSKTNESVGKLPEINQKQKTSKILIENDIEPPYIELIPEKGAYEIDQTDKFYKLKYIPRNFPDGNIPPQKYMVKLMSICDHGPSVYKFDKNIDIPIDQNPPETEEEKNERHKVSFTASIVDTKDIVEVRPKNWSIFINQNKRPDLVSFEPVSEVVWKRSRWPVFNPQDYCTDKIHQVPFIMPVVDHLVCMVRK